MNSSIKLDIKKITMKTVAVKSAIKAGQMGEKRRQLGKTDAGKHSIAGVDIQRW